MSGGGKKAQTIGYWYRPLMHFGLCQGPFDAFLQFRGGDRPAWTGELTSSGEIYVDAAKLWGGEKSEGGIEGYCDVMFGDADQAPSEYLKSVLGVDQPGYRGKGTIVFKGGRYGAMNPYPKPASFKVRRIFKGWDGDVCWYPETAMIAWPVAAQAPVSWQDGYGIHYIGVQVEATGAIEGFNEFTPELAAQYGLTITPVTPSSPRLYFWRPNESGLLYSKREEGTEPNQPMVQRMIDRGWQPNTTALVRHWVEIGLHMNVYTLGATSQAPPAPQGYGWEEASSSPMSTSVGVVRLWHSSDFVRVAEVPLCAMNPAHILYDSIVGQDMAGDPPESINETSFRAAAERLYSEGFGLCTAYDPGSETIEAFRQRICTVIGASCTRSRADGLWYLDLMRGASDVEALPVLVDDDILDFQEDPSTLDDAVNQVAVQWFDPTLKASRTTTPVHSLGAIQALGGVVAETSDYPEIPVEELANRVAARDLGNKATPLKRFNLVTNRAPYAWRTGTYFRLQAPRRGIADMVCMLGDIDVGTLTSGAISLVAVEDIFALPSTTYAKPEPGDGNAPAGGPQASPHQRLFEAPYVALSDTLSAADLAALPADGGYVLAAATRAPTGFNYALYAGADGQPLAGGGTGEWCPGFAMAAAAGPTDTVLTVSAASDLGLVVPGAGALWGREIIRIVALDAETKQVTIARGCADTVPVLHLAGEIVYCFDGFAASDQQQYVDGETVSAKLLTLTASDILEPAAAPTLTVEMASRAARPYPPGAFQINGAPYPTDAFGELSISAAHRDRVLQADQLVDTTAGDIGPEPGVTYTSRFYADGTLEHAESGLTEFPITYTPAGDCELRIELEAVRDGLTSWQALTHTFTYTTTEVGVRMAEGLARRVTEAGQRRVTE